MKRVLAGVLLAGLAVAVPGSRVAIAEGHKALVIRPIFASDSSGQYVGPAVGLVTFNTETGDWTVTTRARLPQSDVSLYYPAISSGPARGYPQYGRWVEEAYFWDYVWAPDGVIDASGTVTPDELVWINQAFANGGIFILITNSI